MKNLNSKVLSVAVGAAFLFSQCTGQKFAFREKIKVEKHEQVAVAKSKPAETKNTETVPTEQVAEQAVYASNESGVSTSTVQPTKAKFWEEKQQLGKEVVQTALKTKADKALTPKKVTKKEKATSSSGGNSSSNWAAITGFVASLVGMFMPLALGLLLCILGIVFSAMGLKSNKRGLAIAGLVIGVVGVVVVLLLAAAVAAAA